MASVREGAVGVMSITPFDASGAVDATLLRAHLDRLAAHPVGIYLCSQGSGEGLGMDLAAKESVYRTAVDAVGGRCELVGAGVGITGDTDSAVEAVAVLSATGVDAIQVFPPRTGALRPRDAEIEGYFAEVTAACHCPVVLGENVTLVGYEMGPSLIRRILDSQPQMTGLSYTASGSVGQLTELVRSLRDRVRIRTGWLQHMANVAAVGGAGILCFEGNVVPGLVSSAWRSLVEGRPDAPGELDRLLAVNALLSRYGNPGSIKAVLAHLGLPAGALRRPLRALPEPEFSELTAAWDRLVAREELAAWL